MMLGEISKYRVLRETDLGYVLEKVDSYDDTQYFLHRNESNYMTLKEEDIVDAFLYVDKKKRFALTCYLPKCTTQKGALCECVSTTSQGAYFNIGISKDMLMSSDDYRVDERPLRGDCLPIKLRLRGNSIFAKLLNKEQILENHDGYKYEVNDKTFGYVYRITKDGVNLVDEHYNIIFVHRNNLRKKHRLGEKIECTITGVNEFDYYGTTILSKEFMIQEDSEVVLNYLKEHHGVMSYTEETDPLIIDRVFHMSKLAFKRALGKLYKEGLIIIEEKRIIMKR